MDEQWPEPHGETLCLDFANTVEPRFRADGHDWLASYRDLARWAEHVGILTRAQTSRLIAFSGQHQRRARRAFESAIALREAIYRVFSALAGRSAVDQADLDLLRDAYAEASRHQSLAIKEGRVRVSWDRGDDELDQIIWPLARDAFDLLTRGPVDRIKSCPAEQGGCAWLFIDGSKNGSRRWCSMRDCGSKVKSRRQNERLRSAPGLT